MNTLEVVALFNGPNPLAVEPVLVADLAIDPALLDNRDAVLAAIRSLSDGWFPVDAELAIGARDGLPAFQAHWALALLNCEGLLHACGWQQLAPYRFRLWLGFHSAELTFTALQLSLKLAEQVHDGSIDPTIWRAELVSFVRRCKQRHPDFQARSAMAAAREDDIPVQPAFGAAKVWQYGWGARTRVLFESAPAESGHLGSMITRNKQETKTLLRNLGLPTPRSMVITDSASLDSAIEQIGFPCVVKPTNLESGVGITNGLRTIDEVRRALDYARSFRSNEVILEAHVEGADYRLNLIEGVLVGTVRRDPPVVIGDGRSTVSELIARVNARRPTLKTDYKDYIAQILIDDASALHLAGQGHTMESVPADGAAVTVRGNANVSTGGTFRDVSADVHPSIRDAVESLALTADLHVTGFDYLTTDVSRPWDETGGAFIEMNDCPGVDFLNQCGYSYFDVGRMLLGQRPGRIPLDLIIVADAEMGAVEQLAAGLGDAPTFGWASANTAQLGRARLNPDPTAPGMTGYPWPGVRTLLAHRRLERAVIFVEASQIVRHGLPIDRAQRIWNCAGNLPDAWKQVLDRASAEPVWHGEAAQLAGDAGWQALGQASALSTVPA